MAARAAKLDKWVLVPPVLLWTLLVSERQAMARFNAPPNWPKTPQGWTPPAGWKPDPAWGEPSPRLAAVGGGRAQEEILGWTSQGPHHSGHHRCLLHRHRRRHFPRWQQGRDSGPACRDTSTDREGKAAKKQTAESCNPGFNTAVTDGEFNSRSRASTAARNRSVMQISARKHRANTASSMSQSRMSATRQVPSLETIRRSSTLRAKSTRQIPRPRSTSTTPSRCWKTSILATR